MSFILDALKKSEAERQRQAGPALLEMRIVRPTRRLPPWAIIVGTLLCGAVLALAWIALRRPGSTASPASPATAVAPAGPGTVPGAQVSASAPAAGPATAPAAAAAAGAFNTSPPNASAPAGSMAALAPSATVPQPQSSASDDENPADAAPAVPPSAGMARERADTSGLRNYSELGGTMPELRLDLHVYAAKPAERYAFINMHKVREGEVTPEGATVKEITPDGVVLEYHGTEFLLGR